MAESGDTAWRLALAAGDLDAARTAAEAALEGETLATALDTIDARSGDPDALARMRARADANPTDVTLLATVAELEDRAGHPAAAQRLRRLAATVSEGYSTYGIPVRTESSCAGHASVPAPNGRHGLFAYRRPTPAVLMPPGVRCLVLDLAEADAEGDALADAADVAG
jgi:hypothetical protein